MKQIITLLALNSYLTHILCMNPQPESLYMQKEHPLGTYNPKNWSEERLKCVACGYSYVPATTSAIIGGCFICAGGGALIFGGGGAGAIAGGVATLLCAIPLGLGAFTGCLKIRNEIEALHHKKKHAREILEAKFDESNAQCND